jgi:hypothetical protein
MLDQNETATCVNCEYEKRQHLAVIKLLKEKEIEVNTLTATALEVMHSKDQYIEELESERQEFVEFKYMLKSILGMV